MRTADRAGQTISHYQIEAFLGSGGMGEVYRATDLRLGRRIAIKFVRQIGDASLRQRLLQEAKSASLLDHPNICTIFEVDETSNGDVFLVMAYYEGETLDRMIARGALDAGRAVSLALQAGRGLYAAHDELIVHRDIKPANLMIARGDTVKILDFGVARLMSNAPITDPGSIIGTPAYMSPEQLRGEPVDQRSDIWSLGAVLYEMATGKAPFRGDTIASVIASVLNDEPPLPSRIQPSVPAPIDRIVNKALAKSMRARYERIDDMIQDLVEAQVGLDSGAITRRFPAATARSSIAVLPFEDMTAAKDQGFLCDGIAEEILRALSRIPDLHVASRTSAFQFKHRPADIREIGSHLGVDAILEGSVRRVGDRVRISTQLISVRDGYRLWYERYDREIKDLFAVEDEIAEQIAGALEITLDPRRSRSGKKPDTLDAEAYQLYLQGRQFIYQHRRKAFEVALQTFTRAIDLNPEYARAYAGIADCHSFLRLFFASGDDSLDAADRASERALQLDPDLSDAHASRGLALFLRNEFDQAEFHLRRAIEIDPQLYDPHYNSGRLRFAQGRMEEAAADFREACAIVPEAFDSWYLLGMCYRRMGDEARARSADFECIEAAKRRVRSHPDDTRAWTMGAAVLAEMGEPERAERWIARAMAVDSEAPIIAYNAACVYARLGRVDEALKCLKTAVALLVVSRQWLENDPDLDPLRGDPRFQAFMASTGQ